MNDAETKKSEADLNAREALVEQQTVLAEVLRAKLEADRKFLDQKLAAWAKLVDMSTHFNELCLSVRRFALATLATVLAASGVAYRFAGHITFADPTIAGSLLPGVFFLFLVPFALFVVVRGQPSAETIGVAKDTEAPKADETAENSVVLRLWNFLGRFKVKLSLDRRVVIFGVLLLVMGVGSNALFPGPLFTLHIAALFIGIAAVVWILCFLVDRFWYHELLRGVTHESRSLEASLSEVGNLSVTTKIRMYSHASLNIPAGAKLSVFYLLIYVILIGTLAVLLRAGQSKATTPGVDSGRQVGPIELYRLDQLPPFPQGSATLTNEIRAALCASRAALTAMRINSVIVVGHHDQTELKPEAKKAFSSNAGLAHSRANAVDLALRDSTLCASAPVESVVPLDSAPLNVGISVSRNDLEVDRRVEIFGLRVIRTNPSEQDGIPIR